MAFYDASKSDSFEFIKPFMQPADKEGNPTHYTIPRVLVANCDDGIEQIINEGGKSLAK